MGIIYGIFGILCLLYYLIIWGYTGRRNSTFSIFWIVLGSMNILLGFLLPHLIPHIQSAVNFAVLVIVVIFIIVEIKIAAAMYCEPPEDLEYLIVLGAQVRGTKITNSLKRRLDRALLYCEQKDYVQIIVSGGQGKGEAIAEALAMKIYLVDHGIPQERILMEAKSKTTEENLLFSKRVISFPESKIGIVTNNFHIFRAIQMGKRIGYPNLYAVPASSNPVLFVNYIVREGFGVLKMILQKISPKG